MFFGWKYVLCIIVHFILHPVCCSSLEMFASPSCYKDATDLLQARTRIVTMLPSLRSTVYVQLLERESQEWGMIYSPTKRYAGLGIDIVLIRLAGRLVWTRSMGASYSPHLLPTLLT